MYCTLSNVTQLLPENITVGSNNLGTPYPGQLTGQAPDRDKLTPDKVNKFIHYASQEIDSRLRSFYVCPLRRTKIFETSILNEISSGSSVTLKVHDSNQFSVYDEIRVQDRFSMELTTVESVTNNSSIVVKSLNNSYNMMESSLVSIVEFPDPIPLICARLAASYIYDQLFSAEQAPDVSNYGIEQRKLAARSMDSVLDGTIRLFGQEHTGRRYIRGSLLDVWKTPVKEFSFGREIG